MNPLDWGQAAVVLGVYFVSFIFLQNRRIDDLREAMNKRLDDLRDQFKSEVNRLENRIQGAIDS